MYLPLWLWIVLVVVGGIAWIAQKVFVQPGLEQKEKDYISQGLAKERDPYLMKQLHTYYLSREISVSQVLESIDLSFLKQHLVKWHVGIAKEKLFMDTGNLESIMAFQAIFQEGNQKNGRIYQAAVTCLKGQAEIHYRLPYNIFLTHIEAVLKELDPDVEVERKLI